MHRDGCWWAGKCKYYSSLWIYGKLNLYSFTSGMETNKTPLECPSVTGYTSRDKYTYSFIGRVTKISCPAISNETWRPPFEFATGCTEWPDGSRRLPKVATAHVWGYSVRGSWCSTCLKADSWQTAHDGNFALFACFNKELVNLGGNKGLIGWTRAVNYGKMDTTFDPTAVRARVCCQTMVGIGDEHQSFPGTHLTQGKQT